MKVQLRSQRLAQKAFALVSGRPERGQYEIVARKFPALIHACGLAQAVAFGQTKKETERAYLDDLAKVLQAGGHAEIDGLDALARQTREADVSAYLRLSRDALEAAVWLKRYAEALAEDTK